METYLEEGNISAEKWNNEIYPLIESGVLKDRSKELPPHFLMIGFCFGGLIEDTDKELYKCSGNSYFGLVIIKKYKI